MKYPKLWNGPHAIGEALTRALNRARAPFLSAAGVGYQANKIGRRSEVFHEGGEPSFYVLYFDAMSRTKYPIRVGKSVTTADVPTAPGYPMWYPWEVPQQAFWFWMRDRFAILAGTNRFGGADVGNMILAREDVAAELTAIPERMVLFYKDTASYGAPLGASTWTRRYSTPALPTTIGGVPSAVISEGIEADDGAGPSPPWLVVRTFLLQNFGTTGAEDWIVQSDYAFPATNDGSSPVSGSSTPSHGMYRLGATDLMMSASPAGPVSTLLPGATEPVAIATYEFPLLVNVSNDNGATWSAASVAALPLLRWVTYRHITSYDGGGNPIYAEETVKEADTRISANWRLEDGSVLLIVTSTDTVYGSGVTNTTIDVYRAPSLGAPFVKVDGALPPTNVFDLREPTSTYTSRGRPLVLAFGRETEAGPLVPFWLSPPTDPDETVWAARRYPAEPAGTTVAKIIEADRGKLARVEDDGTDTHISISSSRGAAWRRIYRIERNGATPRSLIAVTNSKGRPAHIYPDQPWRGDDAITPPWEAA